MNILELSEQEIVRRQSLQTLREMGIDPYPAGFSLPSQKFFKGLLRQINIHQRKLHSVIAFVHTADASHSQCPALPVRQLQRDRISDCHTKNPGGTFSKQHLSVMFRKSPRKGYGTVHTQKLHITAIKNHPFSVQAVVLFSVLIKHRS